MSRYTIDASVAVKWFVAEVHSEAAARWLDFNPVLVAPDLLFAEAGRSGQAANCFQRSASRSRSGWSSFSRGS